MAFHEGPDGGWIAAMAALVVTMGGLLVALVRRITGRKEVSDKAVCVAIQKDIENINKVLDTILGRMDDHTETHHDIYSKVEHLGMEVATIKGRMER